MMSQRKTEVNLSAIQVVVLYISFNDVVFYTGGYKSLHLPMNVRFYLFFQMPTSFLHEAFNVLYYYLCIHNHASWMWWF